MMHRTANPNLSNPFNDSSHAPSSVPEKHRKEDDLLGHWTDVGRVHWDSMASVATMVTMPSCS